MSPTNLNDDDATPRPSTSLQLLPKTRAERLWLLLVATLLPALCVATNTAAFRFVEFNRTLASLSFLFALLIGQIALLGCAAGRLVEHPVWRWLVFGWGIVLVDLLVFSLAEAFQFCSGK